MARRRTLQQKHALANITGDIERQIGEKKQAKEAENLLARLTDKFSGLSQTGKDKLNMLDAVKFGLNFIPGWGTAASLAIGLGEKGVADKKMKDALKNLETDIPPEIKGTKYEDIFKQQIGGLKSQLEQTFKGRKKSSLTNLLLDVATKGINMEGIKDPLKTVIKDSPLGWMKGLEETTPKDILTNLFKKGGEETTEKITEELTGKVVEEAVTLPDIPTEYLLTPEQAATGEWTALGVNKLKNPTKEQLDLYGGYSKESFREMQGDILEHKIIMDEVRTKSKPFQALLKSGRERDGMPLINLSAEKKDTLLGRYLKDIGAKKDARDRLQQYYEATGQETLVGDLMGGLTEDKNLFKDTLGKLKPEGGWEEPSIYDYYRLGREPFMDLLRPSQEPVSPAMPRIRGASVRGRLR